MQATNPLTGHRILFDCGLDDGFPLAEREGYLKGGSLALAEE